jgi:hypothetical protein
MDKPITKRASDATHNGGKDISAPMKYVNKFAGKTSQMMHNYWPKMEQRIEDGTKGGKDLAAANQADDSQIEEECGEGMVKNPAGKCVPKKQDLTKIDLENTDQGGGDGTGTVDLPTLDGG